MSLWPDWNSLDSVKSWHAGLGVAAVALIVLLLCVEALAVRLSQRRDALAAGATEELVASERARLEASERQQLAEIDSLKISLAVANKKIAAYERTRFGRHLDESQKQAIVAFLVAQPRARFTIQASQAAPDAHALAEEIASVFRTAGWTVEVEDAALLESDSSGIWLAARGTIGTPAPPVAQTIYGALKAGGVSIRGGALRENNLRAGEDAMLKIGAAPK